MKPAKFPTPKATLQQSSMLPPVMQQLLDTLGYDDPDAECPEPPAGVAGLRNDPLFRFIRQKALDLLTDPNPDLRSLRAFVHQALQIRRAEFNLWKSANRPRKRKGVQTSITVWDCSEADVEIERALWTRTVEATERLTHSHSPADLKAFTVLTDLLLKLRTLTEKEALVTQAITLAQESAPAELAEPRKITSPLASAPLRIDPSPQPPSQHPGQRPVQQAETRPIHATKAAA